MDFLEELEKRLHGLDDEKLAELGRQLPDDALAAMIRSCVGDGVTLTKLFLAAGPRVRVKRSSRDELLTRAIEPARKRPPKWKLHYMRGGDHAACGRSPAPGDGITYAMSWYIVVERGAEACPPCLRAALADQRRSEEIDPSKPSKPKPAPKKKGGPRGYRHRSADKGGGRQPLCEPRRTSSRPFRGKLVDDPAEVDCPKCSRRLVDEPHEEGPIVTHSYDNPDDEHADVVAELEAEKDDGNPYPGYDVTALGLPQEEPKKRGRGKHTRIAGIVHHRPADAEVVRDGELVEVRGEFVNCSAPKLLRMKHGSSDWAKVTCRMCRKGSPEEADTERPPDTSRSRSGDTAPPLTAVDAPFLTLAEIEGRDPREAVVPDAIAKAACREAGIAPTDKPPRKSNGGMTREQLAKLEPAAVAAMLKSSRRSKRVAAALEEDDEDEEPEPPQLGPVRVVDAEVAELEALARAEPTSAEPIPVGLAMAREFLRKVSLWVPPEDDGLSRDQLRSRRRHRKQGETLGMRKLTRKAMALEAQRSALTAEDYAELERLRPKTRGDCVDGIRPCPFVSCKYNLYLDAGLSQGSIKLNFPDLEPDQIPVSCVLDVADAQGASLEAVGMAYNFTRERARQLETNGTEKLKRQKKVRQLATHIDVDVDALRGRKSISSASVERIRVLRTHRREEGGRAQASQQSPAPMDADESNRVAERPSASRARTSEDASAIGDAVEERILPLHIRPARGADARARYVGGGAAVARAGMMGSCRTSTARTWSRSTST